MPGTHLFDLDAILQGIALLDIVRIIRIGQDAHCRHNIARAELFLGQGIAACAVINGIRVLVFIDDLQGHVAIARVGKRHRHWSGVEIEHCSAIQRVAIHSYDGLSFDQRWRAGQFELAEAVLFDDCTEIQIGLGADEVLDSDGDGRGCCSSHDSLLLSGNADAQLLSADLLDVRQYPGFVEKRLVGTVEAEERLESALGVGRNPIGFLALGRLRPEVKID